MSRISKLSIQGIRSFGPEDRDKGVIYFFTPLTLILGPNGTGKTTIIECLKYITTGELPPGGKNGAAFINDPKIAKESEVKAQVCLQFHDVKDDLCIAKRSLVATQKKTKVEMKTLEGLIIKTHNGERVTLSSKCAEMDREMISLLGVSKPILENVIFCHQEESNWPLSEGKALKQRFDDIFASTRYVKALDAIRKCRQEQVINIREYQVEMKYLKQNKDKVGQVKSRLIDLNEKCGACSDGASKVEEKLKPIVANLTMLEEKEDDIRKISNTIAKLEGEKNQVKKVLLDLQKNIRDIFQGSSYDLDEEISDFGNKVQEKERSLHMNKEKQTVLEKDIEKLTDNKSDILTEKVKFEQEEKRNKSFVHSQNEMIRKMVANYKFEGDSVENSPSCQQVQMFINFMKGKHESLLTENKSKKVEHNERLIKIQKELDMNRGSKTKLETEQKLKQETLKRNMDEVNNINEKLSMMDLSVNQLENLKYDISDTEIKFEDHKKSFHAEGAKDEIQQLQKQISNLGANIKSLDVELVKLNQDLTVRTQLEMFNKDKTVKEEQIRRLLAKNQDTLKHLLGLVPNEFVGKHLEKYIREQSRKVRNISDKLQQLKSSLTKLETRRKIEQETLLKKQEELRGHEQKISNVTQGKDFMEGLSNLTSKLQTNQDNKGHLMAVEYMFKKYTEKLKRENPDCPLCHRPFDEQSEVDELVSEMENKLSVIPDKLEKLQSSISETSLNYEKWLQLNPIKNLMETCRNDDIPKIESSIQSLNAEISAIALQINEREEELDADANDESVGKSLVPDATQLDRIQMETIDLNKKILLQTSKLSLDSSGKPTEEVQSEKLIQSNLRDSLTQQLEQKQTKFEENSSRLHRMQNELHKLRSDQLQIEMDLQSKMKLESTKTDLISANATLMSEIQAAKENCEPVVAEIDKIVSMKLSMDKSHEKEIDEITSRLNKLNEELKQLISLQKEISRYENDNICEKLKSCQEKLKFLELRSKDLENKRMKYISTVDELKQDIAAQKIQLRELEDNKQLMTRQGEIKDMEKHIKVEQDKLGNYGIHDISQQKSSLKKEKERLDKEIEIYKTRRQKLEGEISALKDDLSSDALTDAEQKYKEQMIALKTTELASSDLEKYYKALDRTIMSYHSQKMSEINKIIRELWRNTYKGQDIETIEIRSDEEEGSGAAKNRRTYHYRVVMINRGTELDMRGRCSAGQKVLASLIIRLALAETFCLNCGVLALDEPTTNLDRENIESLAHALVEIIKSRSRQKNFQLLVITHDEDFVELLGRSDYVDEYFRVKKDENLGCSKLSRCKVQDLQTK